MNRAAEIGLVALGTGVAGWVLENLLFSAREGKRYSYHLPNTPFLPIYAAGGASVALLEPHLRNMSTPGRALIYGATLTSLECLAGSLERAEGRRSWDYDGQPVDLEHAVLWAGLGLVVEAAVRRLR